MCFAFTSTLRCVSCDAAADDRERGRERTRAEKGGRRERDRRLGNEGKEMRERKETDLHPKASTSNVQPVRHYVYHSTSKIFSPTSSFWPLTSDLQLLTCPDL